MSDAQAVALPIAGLTALASIERLNGHPGEKLLIIEATGGVGAFAVQIARSRGISVIATARSGKEEVARALGADEYIPYDKTDVVAAVKAAHPDGVTAVFDLVNKGDAIKGLVEMIRAGGRIVSTIAAVDDPQWFAQRNITATNLVLAETPQSSHARLEELLGLIKAGRLNVQSTPARPLNRPAEVLDAFKTGKLSGNVVLEVTAIRSA